MLLDPPSQTASLPYRRDRRTLAAFGLLAALGALHTVLGATLPYLRTDLGLGYGQAGLHLTAFAAAALLAGLGGPAVQRATSRLGLVLAGTGGAAAGAGLVAAAAGLAGSLTGAAVMGAGVTLAFVGLWSGLSDQHGERRAVALTEGEVAVSVGNLSLPLAVGAAAAAGLGWRAALVVVLAAVTAGALGLRRAGVQEPASATTATAGPPGQVARRLAPLLVVVACVVGVEWTLTTWLSTFLDDEVGLARSTAVLATSAFFAAMLAGRLVSSRLARRTGARALLAGALALLLAGLPVLLAARGIPVALAGIVLVGAATGALFPLASALVLAAAGPASTRASGATMAVASVGVLLGPLTIGTLAEGTGLRTALAAAAVLPVTALAVLAVRRC
jgi:predicted MFS family arabinose efflux permease